MMGRFRTLAPLSLALPLAVCFLVFEGLVQYYEFKAGALMVAFPIRPGVAILYAAAGMYGVHRAKVFHPFFDHEYQDWLERTPWTVAKPLPLGPIQLTWEDGVVLGVLVLLDLSLPQHDSVRILCVFLFFHCVTLAASIWWTGSAVSTYLAAFGLGLMAFLWTDHPWACAAAGAAVYLVVYEGVWGALRAFPWERSFTAERLSDQAARDGKAKPKPCGWPYDRLLRDPVDLPPRPATWADAVAWCMLAGWWVFCIQNAIPGALLRGSSMAPLITNVLISSMLVRSSFYKNAYKTPVSLRGRIAVGRWIIPKYDVIYLVPFLMFCAFPILLLTCVAWGAPREFHAPISVAVLLLIASTTPPGLRQWRLTGGHRMVPAISKSNKEYVSTN